MSYLGKQPAFVPLVAADITGALGYTPLQSSDLSPYLTSATAASTYLSQSSAASTYQTQSGMSSYLTTSSASSTYQTQSGMSSYLTTSTAASTYAPSATAVTLTGSQTLTNKTFTGYTETVYTLATSGSVALNPANGTIQSCAAAGAVTFTDSIAAGQSIVLRLANGASYTITWPTMTWAGPNGNAAPTLSAGNVVVLWKEGSTLYGAHVGKYA